MSTDDYLTDASSLDALSEFGDVKENAPFEHHDPLSVTPKISRIHRKLGTPTPLFSRMEIHTPGEAAMPLTFDPVSAYFTNESLFQDEALMNAFKELEIQPLKELACEDNLHKIDIASSIIVFEEFEGPFFEMCKKRAPSQRPKMYGPPAILAASRSNEQRLHVNRMNYPIYSLHLLNCRIAATGISSKEALLELRRKILYMGGSFIERRCERIPGEGIPTHLIADKCRGDKYHDAVSLGRPIVSPEWISNVWSYRHNMYYDASKALNDYRLKCFHACKIAFSGFDDVEKLEMVKLVTDNGGSVVESDDPSATHIVQNQETGEDTTVVDSGLQADVLQTPSPKRLFFPALDKETDGEVTPMKRGRFELNVINDIVETEAEAARSAVFPAEKAKVVKGEWFWNSIQIEACSLEKPYLVEGRANYDLDHTIRSVGTPGSINSPLVYSDQEFTPKPATPGSTGRRKRKRLGRELASSTLRQVEYPRHVSQVTEEGEVPDLGGKSLGQHTDVSDAELANILNQLNKYLTTAEVKSMTRRQIEFYQLLETERNYVSVLMNIVKIFKEPCEREDQVGGRILTQVENRTIFNTLLPIFGIHRRLLRDLFALQSDWNEENLIGKVYYEHAAALRKAYEPFMNSYETVKNEIERCEAEKPRFKALLRIAQTKPECGKQSLTALMIRPVQRLPSTALILQNLAKHTKAPNPDSEWLTKGLEALNECLHCLNEEKAKNEARVAMFETYSEIDGCPAKTISEHRTLINKFDVVTLNDCWGQKHDPITLFLFTDHIQVTKRRGCTSSGKVISSGMSMANLRSPSVSRKSIVPSAAGSNHGVQHKKYKFCEWIDLTFIIKVLDVTGTTTPCFGFALRPNDTVYLRERFLVFQCPDEIPKTDLMMAFAKQLGMMYNRYDFDYYIAKREITAMNLSENGNSVFDKAARFATKTRHKVGRALSLNRTPSKIKRTMSQMISPFTSHRQRPDPDSISQMSTDSPPAPPKSLGFGK